MCIKEQLLPYKKCNRTRKNSRQMYYLYETNLIVCCDKNQGSYWHKL